jgi:hypothetical protein
MSKMLKLLDSDIHEMTKYYTNSEYFYNCTRKVQIEHENREHDIFRIHSVFVNRTIRELVESYP